jgi:hypothetical protein
MSPTGVKIVEQALKKFDGTNFLLWQYKMKMYLIAKKLWPYVDRDTSLDGSGIEESTAETMDLIQLAHAALIMHTEDNQLVRAELGTEYGRCCKTSTIRRQRLTN